VLRRQSWVAESSSKSLLILVVGTVSDSVAIPVRKRTTPLTQEHRTA